MILCKKCNCEFQGNYCPHCGQQSKVERITGRYIATEIATVFNLQKGFFYTVKELVIRPGNSIRTFISEERNRFVKPIAFILVTSLIYTIVVAFFHFQDGVIDSIQNAYDNPVFNWVENHYGYANIIMAFFISLWLKIFFRKYPYNIFEILVLLCYVMGVGMLIYTLFDIIIGITQVNLLYVEAIVGLIYTTYAIGQFYDKKKVVSYAKALVSYLLGMLVFTLVLSFLTILIK